MVASTAAYELRFDSGRICLDLLATAHPVERLDGTGALCAWLVGAGLVPAGGPLGRIDVGCLLRFRELRADIDQLIRAEPALDRRPLESALDRINTRARGAPPAPRAVLTDDGRLVRRLHDDPDGPALLAAVARDLIELLTDPVAASRIRQCEGDNCSLVYLDTSRGRRRRWCSSEVCGNRERVARHRRRMAVS
ncbi:CGNR zinc finger domain-containing protein [Streptomyces sp. NPDC050418]|uniref:CGNR zinc finger domain-containing protein n=1 Tax=Streptomyces sp. NPDC050418 TaxID=3365612 RepID=UPI00379F7174